MIARVPGRAILIGMLMAAPWMLGSIAGWSQVILCLCGLVALAFWWLEIAILRPRQVVLPLSVIPIVMGIGLGVLQFAPLPESIANAVGAGHAYQQWDDLSSATALDRDLVDQLALHTKQDVQNLLKPATKSISIDPNATRLMTAQLVLAAICYLLGAHFFNNRSSLIWLCTFLTINGVAVALYGIVQRINGDNHLVFGWIYVHQINFGPYVNRNNAAGFLTMCLAAAVMLMNSMFTDEHESHLSGKGLWHSVLRVVYEINARKVATVAAVMFIASGIVTSLSRGGTLAMLAGAVAAFLVLGVRGRDSRDGSMVFMIGALVLGMGLVGWLGFGDQLMERFEEADRTEIMDVKRIENWTDTAGLIGDQWLVGSGLSSYQHVHRPLRSSPELNLFVFAENQYFQAIIDGGVIGLVLLLVMIAWTIYFIRFLIVNIHSDEAFPIALFGCFALASQAVASFFDFGLYMPANMVTFALIMGAIAGSAQAYSKRQSSRRQHFADLNLGKLATPFLLLLFGGGILALLQVYHRYQLETRCLAAKEIQETEYLAQLPTIDQAIAELKELSDVRPDVELQIATAELLITRFRAQQFERILENAEELTPEEKLQIWNSTLPVTSATYLAQLNEINPTRASEQKSVFRANRELKDAVLPAYAALLRGRKSSPFTPEVHLQLAENGTVLSDLPPREHLRRVIEIAPKNPGYQMMAGVYLLREINFDSQHQEQYKKGIEHLQTAIALSPRITNLMSPLVLQRNILGTWVYGLSPEVYAEQLLLDYPDKLYSFVTKTNYFKEFPDKKNEVFAACLAQALDSDQARYWDYYILLPLARMAYDIEDYAVAKDYANTAAMKKLPPNEGHRIEIRSLIGLEQFAEARSKLQDMPAKEAQSLKRLLEQREKEALERIRQLKEESDSGKQDEDLSISLNKR